MGDVDIEPVLEAFEDNDIILVLAPSDAMEDLNARIMEEVSGGSDSATIYVTVAKPYTTIRNILEERDVDLTNIFFVDCISKQGAGETVQADNVVFTQPEALTDISIALSSAVDNIPDDMDKLLVLDTLSTLMMYNDNDTVGRFAHDLSGKIRDWGIKSIMLTLEEETDEQIVGRIGQFVDETVEI